MGGPDRLFILAVKLFVTLIEFTDNARGLHPLSLRPLQQDCRSRREGAGQCRRLREGDGARCHRRHRRRTVSQFTTTYGGCQPTIEQTFCRARRTRHARPPAPGIANGLFSGAPQLGAGAAVGTSLAVAGAAMAGGASLALAGRGALAAAALVVRRWREACPPPTASPRPVGPAQAAFRPALAARAVRRPALSPHPSGAPPSKQPGNAGELRLRRPRQFRQHGWLLDYGSR
ncbi:hypothetical protein ABID62_009424 [Bradyrhizobium sp. S3.9.1]